MKRVTVREGGEGSIRASSYNRRGEAGGEAGGENKEILM